MELFIRYACLAMLIGCGPEFGNAQENTSSAEKHWKAFQENVHSIATCDLRVQLRAMRIDPQFVTNQHRYRISGDLIRWDQLSRIKRPQGVLSENLTQLFFDGSRTIQLTGFLAGLERDFSPLQTRGIRCQVSPGLARQLDDAIIFQVLRLTAFAAGGAPSFSQIPSLATSAELINDKTPTVRYTLPDLKQGSYMYTERFVEFDFDPAHGWWISHARFGATPNTASPTRGRFHIEEFYDLGNGRFFPKTLVSYSHTADSEEKRGPVTEVTHCRINEPIDEAELVLETPAGLPISVETRREGNLRISKLQVRSETGESKEFQEHDEFKKFAFGVDGQDEWTGHYTPPSYFNYYFEDEQQAKALLQQSMGTGDLSPLRSQKEGDASRGSGAESGGGATDRPTSSSSYLLWGGLAIFAIVAFFAIQHVSRSRMMGRQCGALHSGGNLKS